MNHSLYKGLSSGVSLCLPAADPWALLASVDGVSMICNRQKLKSELD